MSDSDRHLIGVICNYYLDIEKNKMYYYRWDTFLVTKNYMNEYLTMVYKTDDQRNRILDLARKKADSILNSKLYKAMK